MSRILFRCISCWILPRIFSPSSSVLSTDCFMAVRNATAFFSKPFVHGIGDGDNAARAASVFYGEDGELRDGRAPAFRPQRQPLES